MAAHGNKVGKEKNKKLKLDLQKSLADQEDQILCSFASWCLEAGFTFNEKVHMTSKGVKSGRGMVARATIENDELLFSIPRSALLLPQTSAIADVVALLAPVPSRPAHSEDEDEEGSEKDLSSESGSSWAPLLLTFMFEYVNPTSKWKPYFSLLPKKEDLQHPHFWKTEEQKEFLSGTTLVCTCVLCSSCIKAESLADDVSRMEHEYETVVLPFMKQHADVFDLSKLTVDLYKHLAAVVMAYSFTDDQTGSVMMAPVADLLNHCTGACNAHLYYNDHALEMFSISRIAAGQEIFNTYGELSSIGLFRKYGYVEDHTNIFEEVEIPLAILQPLLPDANFQHVKQALDSGRIGDLSVAALGPDDVPSSRTARTGLRMLNKLLSLLDAAADETQFQSFLDGQEDESESEADDENNSDEESAEPAAATDTGSSPLGLSATLASHSVAARDALQQALATVAAGLAPSVAAGPVVTPGPASTGLLLRSKLHALVSSVLQRIA